MLDGIEMPREKTSRKYRIVLFILLSFLAMC